MSFECIIFTIGVSFAAARPLGHLGALAETQCCFQVIIQVTAFQAWYQIAIGRFVRVDDLVLLGIASSTLADLVIYVGGRPWRRRPLCRSSPLPGRDGSALDQRYPDSYLPALHCEAASLLPEWLHQLMRSSYVAALDCGYPGGEYALMPPYGKAQNADPQ